MRGARLPISVKLLFLLSGMAALATGLALGVQDRVLSRDLEKAATTRLEGAAEGAKLLVSGHIEAMTERYTAVSGTPQFRATLEVGDRPTLTFYAERLAERGGADVIAFRDVDGRILALSGDLGLLAEGEHGLVAQHGEIYASVSVPLETNGTAVGKLIAAERIDQSVLMRWSNLCGAEVMLRPREATHSQRADELERTVCPVGDHEELRVAASLDAEQDALAHSRLNLIAAGGMALAIAFFASFFLSRSIVRPILAIQSATERIAGGDFEVRTRSRRRDEIGDVARAFDGMLERLRRFVSEQKRIQARLMSAQRLARMGSWQVDLQSGELTVSAECREILGLPAGDPEKAISHEHALSGVHPEDRSEVERALLHSLTTGGGLHLDYRVVVGDSERVVHTQARLVSDDEGGGRRLEGTVQDVTDRRRTEEQIRYLAYHDSLTGLGNRRLFAERLDLSIARARRNGTALGVLYLDLDQFKRINDTLGHSAGDQLLQQVADRLVAIVRDSDLVVHQGNDFDTAVSRLGGDEFTLLVSDVADPRDLAKVARRILETLAKPFTLQDHQVVVSGSIGITTWPMDGEDVEALLRNADTAMYHAKNQGRNNYQFYAESMNAASLKRLTLEQKLRRALEEGELELHYQPKVALRSGEVTGFEALVRWRDPELGLVMPGDFIPIAEETGLIVQLGDWVLLAACRQLARWRDEGGPQLPVAVNISVQHFRTGNLVDSVLAALGKSGTLPGLLEIEITESTLMVDDKAVVSALDALRQRGIRIAIDDFGTGYSSLAYLRRLPVDILKIDRSFVSNIERDPGDASLAAAIVSMGQALGLKLVAEGVETPGQQALLEGWGCDEFQGFVFSKALPPDELALLLARVEPGPKG